MQVEIIKQFILTGLFQNIPFGAESTRARLIKIYGNLKGLNKKNGIYEILKMNDVLFYFGFGARGSLSGIKLSVIQFRIDDLLIDYLLSKNGISYQRNDTGTVYSLENNVKIYFDELEKKKYIREIIKADNKEIEKKLLSILKFEEKERILNIGENKMRDDNYRVSEFKFLEDELIVLMYPLHSGLPLPYIDPEFWEKYKNVLFLYKNANDISFDGNLMPKKEVYDQFTNRRINEECPNNLLLIDYLNYSRDIKIIITKVKHLMSSGRDILLWLKRVESYFTFSVDEPCYYEYCIRLMKAFIAKDEVQLVVDIKSNMVLSIKYPCEEINLKESAIQERIVPLLPEKIQKTSSIKLPKHESLKNIENLDLEWKTICYYIYNYSTSYYFTDASNCSMTLCQMRLPDENYYPYLDYSEPRVKKYLSQFLVSVEDLRQTMLYLIDIEEYEKIKAFLPSFYYNYPNKEFISFYRATDSHTRSILPGWTGVYKPFFDLIPDELKYWIIDGKDWSKEFF